MYELEENGKSKLLRLLKDFVTVNILKFQKYLVIFDQI